MDHKASNLLLMATGICLMTVGGITTSCQVKCVPMIRGLLSMHIFMLLCRFISESVELSSDFTWKCKTAIEIGTPLDDIC